MNTRDEQLHVGLFARIFQALLADFPELDNDQNKQWAAETLKEAAELEIEWGNHIIGTKFDGIDMADMEEYVRFMANKRAVEIGVPRPFSRDNRNPLPWIRHYEDISAAKVDFFEARVRAYAKPNADNGFDNL